VRRFPLLVVSWQAVAGTGRMVMRMRLKQKKR
jgi:hypothetical protein